MAAKLHIISETTKETAINRQAPRRGSVLSMSKESRRKGGAPMAHVELPNS